MSHGARWYRADQPVLRVAGRLLVTNFKIATNKVSFCLVCLQLGEQQRVKREPLPRSTAVEPAAR